MSSSSTALFGTYDTSLTAPVLTLSGWSVGAGVFQWEALITGTINYFNGSAVNAKIIFGFISTNNSNSAFAYITGPVNELGVVITTNFLFTGSGGTYVSNGTVTLTGFANTGVTITIPTTVTFTPYPTSGNTWTIRGTYQPSFALWDSTIAANSAFDLEKPTVTHCSYVFEWVTATQRYDYVQICNWSASGWTTAMTGNANFGVKNLNGSALVTADGAIIKSFVLNYYTGISDINYSAQVYSGREKE